METRIEVELCILGWNRDMTPVAKGAFKLNPWKFSEILGEALGIFPGVGNWGWEVI